MILTALLALAAAQDPDLERVREFERELRALVDRVTPAYVFFGGGSGVVISPDGWILTNHHVAGDQTDMHITITGGRALTADVIGFDPSGDIAVLKARGVTDLPFCPVGDSDAMQVGDFVVAVGDPFILGMESQEPTVTFGMISAMHRYFDWYSDAIMTDARINPGNSGGPLLNLRGEVVGINGRVQIRWETDRVSTGMGFSVPINQIKRFLPQMRMGGRTYHGYIEGIQIAMPDLPEFEYLGVPYGGGVLVTDVRGTASTPAVRAGFDAGDLITEIEGYRIYNSNRFHGVLATFPHGSTVHVRFKRRTAENQPWTEWEDRETTVWLGDPERPAAGPEEWRHVNWGFRAAYGFEGPGLRVDSASAEGLQAGDVVIGADGRAVNEFIDFATYLLEKNPGDAVTLRVRRGDAELDVPLTLRAPEAPREPGPEDAPPMPPTPPDGPPDRP